VDEGDMLGLMMCMEKVKSMKVINTEINDLYILEPKVFGDDRGYFFESYNKMTLDKSLGKEYNFVQDNESKSSYGVIRGLHYQLAPFSQTKIVRVLQGKVYDVAVDLRKDSPSFLDWVGVELSAENKRQLLIPKGFAHGFSVLSETAIFAYKCDEYYHPEAEAGIVYNDPSLDIDWKIKDEDIIVSQKDMLLTKLEEAKINF
jgi:dTDP-4-dehydrorhamnose 3,5-epimerase